VAVQTSNHPSETLSAPRTLVLTRVFDAPRQLVWEAWTNPRHLAQWWGPHEFTAPRAEMDVRPGGALYIDTRAPDGSIQAVTGTVREATAPERLVFTSRLTDEDGGVFVEILNTVRAAVTFDEMGARTRITMRAVFHSADARELVFRQFGAYEGAHQTLNRLARFLATV